jgi:hypothetical protein
MVSPPIGWKPEPLKASESHRHQVWLSPSGETAYGVIHFSLPLPLPASFIVGPFVDQMARSEGEAILISREPDSELPGVRLVLAGGLYKIRANLLTRGFDGWAIYDGTLRDHPENPQELALAIAARERTRIGMP